MEQSLWFCRNSAGIASRWNLKTQEEYEKALIALYEEQIVPALKQGLCGAVYTQVSDVEDEINGLLTYDRKTCKVGADEMRTMAEKLKL